MRDLLKSAALAAAIAGGQGEAQTPWRFANPSPHGNNIIDMGMREGAVWQIGDRGSLHTSADLDNWSTHETGVKQSLRGLAFQGANVCIVGEAGLVLTGSGPDLLAIRQLPTQDWLESVAASASAWVAVGDNGAIYRSGDAATWTRQGNFSTWLRSVAFGGGQFLAVGEDGFAATSPDGTAWTTRPTGTTAHLNRVAYLGDRFWIVGEAGTVLTNNARMNISAVHVGVTNELFAVAGNGTDVVIAGDQAVLLGRADGTGWTPQMDAASVNKAPIWPFYSALWDGRLFLLGGRTGMKAEGFRTNAAGAMQWVSEPQPTRSWLWSLTRQGEVFAAAGAGGTIVTSVDGISWSREVVPAAARGEILLGIGGSSNALVAAGSAGTLLVSPAAWTNVVSTNASGVRVTNLVDLLGVFWNAAAAPTANDLQGVAASGSTYVVTGAKGTILTSSNGTNWQQRSSGTGAYLSGVAWGDGNFMACGDGGTLLSSADGIAWQPRNSGVTSWIYVVRHLGGRWVAVGQGGLVLTSEDGLRWTKRNTGTTEWINDVTYADGRWVAVAGFGWLVTSSDGIEWSASKSITARSLYGAATDGGQLVAAGLEGVIVRQQLTVPGTPVNFLSIDAGSGQAFFLLGGQPGQRFALESQTGLQQPWQTESIHEFSGGSATVIHQRALAPADPIRFFRTRLLP
jgi:hypothetical protein